MMDYIKRLLMDKTRLKQWKKRMLGLSCVIVFCTVYALILPAVTLEKEAYAGESVEITETETTETETTEAVAAEDELEEPEGMSVIPEDELAVAATATDGWNLSDSSMSSKVEVSLSYQEADGSWVSVDASGSGKIPANAKFKVTISYKNVPTADLRNNYNCTLKCDLPELLKNITSEGTIVEGTEEVGTVSTGEGVAAVTFKEEYLQKKITDGKTTIQGDFHIIAEIDLTNVPTNGKTTLTVAGKDFDLDFGNDPMAQYGKVDIKKECVSSKVIQAADGLYVAYTIKVTAGEYACPDVTVVDQFVNNKEYVSYTNITTAGQTLAGTENGQNSYEQIAPGQTYGTIYWGNIPDTANPIPASGTSVTSMPGSLVWKIGDMEANESRTLTYYVKLKEDAPLNAIGDIKNQAEVYSKKYKKNEDDAVFKPAISYEMPKDKVGITRNSDGSYTIEYRINFTLKESESNYPLQNFEFLDYLNYSGHATAAEALTYISYNRDSVKLFVKKNGDTLYSEVAKSEYTTGWSKDQTNYNASWTDADGNPVCFKITGTAGNPINVNPGDSYYATYTVNVKPEALAAVKADSVDVKNRYLVNASNAYKKFGNAFDRVWHTEKVGDYKWAEKQAGAKTSTDQSVTMSTTGKYDLTGGSIVSDSSSADSFTIPAGSYPYTVNVNRTLGEWNLCDVSMKDALSSDKMEYTGYMKVDACEYNAATGSYDTKETKWVKIDGLRSFALKASELGWNNVNYAYTLTYYAKPVKQETFSAVTVTNTFSLEGNAERGGGTFDITGITSKKDVTVSGDFSMKVTKAAWYFEEPAVGATTWTNGSIYWVIEVSGTAILKDTAIRDSVLNGAGMKNSYLHNDSLAGIYKGNLTGATAVTEYEDLKDLLDKATGLEDVKEKFTVSLTNSKGFGGTDRYSELTVKAGEQITLGGEKLYLIVKTEPELLPVDGRDVYTYKNKVSTSDNDTDWIDQSTASQSLHGGADILKELGQTFTYDGTKITSNNDGRDGNDTTKIVKDNLDGAGLYASWAFKLNYAGEMSGKYRVQETIPDGMELVYIRIKWTGTSQGQIYSTEMPELLSDGWTEKTITAVTDNSRSETTTYYVKDNQALIELGDFKAGRITDHYSVDMQVVCKVTDPDVLLGGKTKTFTNQVTLQTTDGKDINTATSSASLKMTNLEKSFETAAGTAGRVNFTIKANPLGQELPTEEGTELKLIDKLSSTLILDTTTIKVVNSKSNADVDFTASLASDNTLEIKIPSNVPVTITYTAIVNAPPGKKVSFSNVVYWEKYTPSDGTKVEVNDYTYTAGGSVSGGENIKLDIIKKDKNNLSTLLQNAKFEMVECELDTASGAINEKAGSPKWTGMTDVAGKLTFGNGTTHDPVMHYNTIYKVTEKEAPTGYIKDNTIYYIMVPKINSGETDYSDYVKECMKKSEIRVQYQETYELTVMNHRGEITVEKVFYDAGGIFTSPVSGTYWFGLYENSDGTNAGGTITPLQKISITYSAGETSSKTGKFINLDLSKTYYVFELDDAGQPIQADSGVVTVNGMEYLTSYQTSHTGGVSNSAVSQDTVTVINQSRVKELPQTGGVGVYLFRIAGMALIVLSGLLIFGNIKRKNSRK